MSTAGTGLWDNEKSIERVGRFTKLSAKPTLIDYLVAHSVQLWFGETDGTTFARAIDRRSKEVSRLPKPLFNAFADIARIPGLTSRGARLPAHKQVLGSNRDGFRVQALLDLPEVPALLTPMADALVSRLDKAFKSNRTLAQEPLIELGVLLELTNARVFQTPERAAQWEKAFMEMSARTTEDRPFWDEFVGRVRPAFSMLVAPGG